MSEMQEQKMLQQFNALGIFRCLLLLTVCYLSAKVMHESELLKNSFLSFSVPCESGNYWKCDVSSCVACPQGFYQPQWGQTSCWPCPFNTTTDFEGASSPTECKREYYIPYQAYILHLSPKGNSRCWEQSQVKYFI